MLRLTLSLLLLTSTAALAQADAGVTAPLQVNVRATPDKAKLGEPFEVEVVVTHLSDQRYELVPPSDEGDFEHLGHERHRVDGAQDSTTTFRVKLAGFALGEKTTPPLSFEVTTPQGTGALTVPGTKVEIVTSLPADAQQKGADLYDVRPPEEVPVRTWRLVYALLIALGAAALAYLLVRYLQRPKAPALLPDRPPEPLHTRTLKALDELAKENLHGRGQVKAFYFRLSEIVRGYLGELYAFEALESTTPELLEALRTRPTPGLPMEQLAAFANESDFVRYARATPDVDQCKAALELGYRVVHLTTAAPAPTPRPSAPKPPAATPPSPPPSNEPR